MREMRGKTKDDEREKKKKKKRGRRKMRRVINIIISDKQGRSIEMKRGRRMT